MKKKSGRLHTIYWRVFVPLLVVIVLLVAMFSVVLVYSGVLDRVQNNSIDMFEEKTSGRKEYIKNEMLGRWSNLADEEKEISDAIAAQLVAAGCTAEDMHRDWELNAQILEELSPRLIEILRLKQTTGIFCILDGIGVNGNPDSYASMYVRDTDPTNSSANNTDLLLVRGLPTLARELNISLESFWEASCSFPEEDASDAAFFFNPLRYAELNNATESRYYGYWSDSFRLGNSEDLEIITYSMPITGEDGAVYGVLGIDITTSYLSRMLTYDEIVEDKRGVYALGYSTDGGSTYTIACKSGPAYQSYFNGDTELLCSASDYGDLVHISSENSAADDLLASVQPISLYDRNTPFENQQWALIAVAPHDSLLGFATQFRNMILLCVFLMLILGIGAAVFTSRRITDPITRLAGELKHSNPDKAIVLQRIRIQEIDELSASIETLSNSVAESSSRISKIIRMAHIPLGVFEYHKSTDLAYCSESLFEVMGWTGWDEDKVHYTGAELKALFGAQQIYDAELSVYQIQDPGKDRPRWVQITLHDGEDQVLGAVLDVTDDVIRKRKIEYERDYDTLTSTLNRRAFRRILEDLFQNRRENLKTAALLMLDLDNLKYLNDKYGHDCGDRYIQAFSEKVRLFEQYGAVVARRSGDEFYVLIYGRESKEEIREIVRFVWKSIESSELMLPDGDPYKIRASGGIAWYPSDSQQYEELVHYADFAMYSVKHNIKGDIAEFDGAAYKNDAILVNGAEALNRLIEEELVRYAFQPIVDTQGDVFGYEMLMRPQVREFSQPQEVLRIAKAQFKMQHIERLTWKKALSAFDDLCRRGKIDDTAHVFINSISSHALSAASRAQIETSYPDRLQRVVLEITEGEHQNEACFREKLEMIRGWGGMIAIDDFGTGYNSELSLISCEPNIVKLDISLVRDVDKDENRQSLIAGIVEYAKAQKISVLAEGVETTAEMRTLVLLGIDLIQGYYVARPTFDPSPIPDDVVLEIRRAADEAAHLRKE